MASGRALHSRSPPALTRIDFSGRSSRETLAKELVQVLHRCGGAVAFEVVQKTKARAHGHRACRIVHDFKALIEGGKIRFAVVVDRHDIEVLGPAHRLRTAASRNPGSERPRPLWTPSEGR